MKNNRFIKKILGMIILPLILIVGVSGGYSYWVFSDQSNVQQNLQVDILKSDGTYVQINDLGNSNSRKYVNSITVECSDVKATDKTVVLTKDNPISNYYGSDALDISTASNDHIYWNPSDKNFYSGKYKPLSKTWITTFRKKETSNTTIVAMNINETVGNTTYSFDLTVAEGMKKSPYSDYYYKLDSSGVVTKYEIK